MTRVVAFGACAAALACGAGPRPPQATPSPAAAPRPAAAMPPPTAGPISYRIMAPLTYIIERRDSLSIASGGGIQIQASAKRAVVTVRPGVGKGTVEIALDSLEPLGATHLSSSALDSAIGTRWRGVLPDRPGAWLTPDRDGVLVGQIGQALWLLFMQLPRDSVRASQTWSSPFRVPVVVDAFNSTEQGTRTSRVAAVTPSAITVEFVDELLREGSASQGGQLLRVSGMGKRAGSGRVRVEGVVEGLELTESDELVVTQPAGPPVPVRQTTSIRIALRDSRAR